MKVVGWAVKEPLSNSSKVFLFHQLALKQPQGLSVESVFSTTTEYTVGLTLHCSIISVTQRGCVRSLA